MVVNGFKFYSMGDFSNRWYEARRGDVVITSKSLAYLKKKVKKLPQETSEKSGG